MRKAVTFADLEATRQEIEGEMVVVFMSDIQKLNRRLEAVEHVVQDQQHQLSHS